MAHWYGNSDCGCKVYRRAVVCAGQAGSDTSYSLFVHSDDMPASSTVFAYNELCFTIDPDFSLSCFPNVASDARKVFPSFFFDDCSTCINDSEPSDDSGPPPAPGPPLVESDLPPGAVVPGGPDDDGGNSEAYSDVVLASVCAAHSSRTAGNTLYIWKSSISDYAEYTGSDTAYFHVRWVLDESHVCYSVSNSTGLTNWNTVSDNANTWVGRISGSYSDCDACTNGIPLTVCPDQPNSDSASTRYMSLWNPPAEIMHDRQSGFCYEFDPADSQVLIPSDQTNIIEDMTNQFDDCSDCGYGVQATPCPDQVNAPAVWVKEKYIPLVGSDVIFKHNGFCYTIASDASSFISFGATVVVPPADTLYDSCSKCLCGIPTLGLGAKVNICDWQQATAGLVRDWWVRSDDLPSTGYTWLEEGVCVTIGANAPIIDIPVEAVLVQPLSSYSNCYTCVSFQSDGGGGGIPPWPPWVDPPPKDPWEPPDNRVVRELLDCDDDSGTGIYISSEWALGGRAVKPNENVNAGGGALISDHCYYTASVLTLVTDVPHGSIPSFSKQWFFDCDACEESIEIDDTKWYCVLVNNYSTDPDCSGEPGISGYDCLLGSVIGSWGCHPRPGPPDPAPTIEYIYISGPYDSEALCNAAGCAAP